MQWEALRLELLERLGRNPEIAERAARLPADAPAELAGPMLHAGARAALKNRDPALARTLVARLLWREAAAEGERGLRLLVIDTYLDQKRPGDAYQATLRFQQDFQPLSKAQGEKFAASLARQGEGGKRLLRLNAPREGYHSVRLGHAGATGDYYDVLSLGPLLAQGRRVLVLGMGGGTTVTAYRRLYPGARITAVEIYPLVVRVAHEYMGLERGPDVEVRVGDARAFLRRGAEVL